MVWFSKISALSLAIVIFILSSILLPGPVQNILSQSEDGISSLLLFVIILIFSLLGGRYFFLWLKKRGKSTKLFVGFISCLSGLTLSFMCLFVFLLGFATSDLCSETLIIERYSPNQKFKAFISQIDCGATTGFNTHVDIERVDNSSSKMSLLQEVYGKKERKVFLAENGYTKRSAGIHGGPEVHIKWEDNSKLSVCYHESSRIKIKNTPVKGVEILFQAIN